MSYNILVINPGSTSTKIGVYQDETLVFDETLRHSAEEIAKYSSIYEQKDFRKEVILSVLKDKNYNIQDLHVIVGRGGMLKPIPGGTYSVTDALMHDLEIGLQGQHASNLGGILAREIGDTLSIPSYIVDPVVVDELEDVARLSGVPSLPRRSVFHALNQKAVAKRYAKEIGVPYESLRLIVVHLGGGFSVGAHANGRVIDVNNALDGEGAFSPERAGTVPAGDLVKLCFSGKYTEKEIYRMLVGGGGYSAYRNTNDARDVERDSLAGDSEATLVLNAMRYQVAKDIGAMATVLKGKVDQIILTGGVAYSPNTCNAIGKATDWIANLTVYPGEDELLALAQGALRVLQGQEDVQQYA